MIHAVQVGWDTVTKWWKKYAQKYSRIIPPSDGNEEIVTVHQYKKFLREQYDSRNLVQAVRRIILPYNLFTILHTWSLLRTIAHNDGVSKCEPCHLKMSCGGIQIQYIVCKLHGMVSYDIRPVPIRYLYGTNVLLTTYTRVHYPYHSSESYVRTAQNSVDTVVRT